MHIIALIGESQAGLFKVSDERGSTKLRKPYFNGVNKALLRRSGSLSGERAIKLLVSASHSAARGTGLGKLGTASLVEPAANRKALAGDVIGILRGETELRWRISHGSPEG